MSLTDIFFKVAEMSAVAFTAGFAVCIFALPLELIRAFPRRAEYFMLFIVVFRLVCPFSLNTPLSAFNFRLFTAVEEAYSLAKTENSYVGDYQVALIWDDEYQTAIEAEASPQYAYKDIRAVFYTHDADGNIVPAKTFRDVYGQTAAVIWLAGWAIFTAYGVLSYVYLRRKVSTATLICDNIYETDRVNTPFVLGFFHPRIYLPIGLEGEKRRYIICHEQMHIKHGDQIVKAAVYFIMCIHWFNLVLWCYFYRLFTYEIELACDGSVIDTLGEQHKADYSMALLSASGKRHFIGAVPCGFGETQAKGRINAVLKHRRTNNAWRALAVLLFVFAFLFAGTDAAPKAASVNVSSEYTDGAEYELSFDAGNTSYGIYADLWDEDGMEITECLLSGDRAAALKLKLDIFPSYNKNGNITGATCRVGISEGGMEGVYQKYIDLSKIKLLSYSSDCTMGGEIPSGDGMVLFRVFLSGDDVPLPYDSCDDLDPQYVPTVPKGCSLLEIRMSVYEE